MCCGPESRLIASWRTRMRKPAWLRSCAGAIRIRPSMRRICVGRSMTEAARNESGDGSTSEDAAFAAAPPPLAPGVQLAARRQQLNMTVEQVANQLNLAPRQIQALEADNYRALPGMASVRGF